MAMIADIEILALDSPARALGVRSQTAVEQV